MKMNTALTYKKGVKLTPFLSKYYPLLKYYSATALSIALLNEKTNAGYNTKPPRTRTTNPTISGKIP